METTSFKEEMKKELQRIYQLGVAHGRELERATQGTPPCNCPNAMYCDGSCFPKE
jgi:hypothetical protein